MTGFIFYSLPGHVFVSFNTTNILVVQEELEEMELICVQSIVTGTPDVTSNNELDIQIFVDGTATGSYEHSLFTLYMLM